MSPRSWFVLAAAAGVAVVGCGGGERNAERKDAVGEQGGTGGNAGDGGGDAAGGMGGADAADAAGDGGSESKPGDGGVLKGYIYANSDIYLFRMDALGLVAGTPKVEKVGEFGTLPDSMTDLAVTPDDHIYAISWNSGAPPNKLWEIDPDTAKPTFITEITGASNVALTFDIDGTLIGVDKGGGVRRIDPKTGSVTEIGSWGGGLGAAGDIVGLKDGKMYGFSDAGGIGSETNNSLLSFDPKTGAATEIGLTGYDNLWGIAFWCGKVYGFSADAYAIEVDVATGKGTRLTMAIPEAKSGFYGAGVTPKAPLGATAGDGCKP